MLKNLPFSKEAIDLLKKHGKILHYKKGSLLENCTRSNKDVCILLSGIIKMCIKHGNKKLLLYHVEGIKPKIINYTNTSNISSDIVCGTVLKDAIVLNTPNDLFLEWASTYIELRDFMITSYQYHYINIINKTQEVNSRTLEEHLLGYIKTKSKLYKNPEIKVPVLEISEDLNFSREAISRGLKNLEINNKIIRKTRSIVLLFLIAL
ncbi:Crp/Fnr family transcriptional regulator [Tenacibaculum ovolyticum]|uniref:Crp/Fnr family transcriptional regulator n=1 Tax=Tenacibaculum ovolyticum TaxID=104270 RepID=UPI00040B633C|nr:Crp/Fnr family transcriptional regulator [Tenacibaculum ovolyticum]